MGNCVSKKIQSNFLGRINTDSAIKQMIEQDYILCNPLLFIIQNLTYFWLVLVLVHQFLQDLLPILSHLVRLPQVNACFQCKSRCLPVSGQVAGTQPFQVLPTPNVFISSCCATVLLPGALRSPIRLHREITWINGTTQ